MKFVLDLTICIFANDAELADKLFADLYNFGLTAAIIDDYPSVDTPQNILLLDASFDEEIFGGVSLSFPVLKLFNSSYPNFKKIDFHDFIIYPFKDRELISRILNLSNLWKNFQSFNRVNSELKSYLLNLSHDVSSPLQLIKSQIEYLRSTDICKNAYYETIFDNTVSKLTAVSTLLASVPYSSSAASDAIAINDDKYYLNFALLIQDVFTQLSSFSSSRSIDIVVFIEQKVSNAYLNANYAYIWRLVYNLVFNAIKYSPGGGTIKLSLFETSDGLRFEVKDTGIGMTSLQLRELQDYFVSSDDHESRLGRGLVVVKVVVNSLNASVYINSELGKGTTFTIDFPFDNIRFEEECKVEVKASLLQPVRVMIGDKM